VTVTDLNGCTAISTALLTQPPVLSATAAVTSNYNGYSVGCNGGTNGSATVNATGGTPGYLYNWSYNNVTTQNLTGIGAGTYFVTVTDLNGCTATSSVTLTQPSVITATATVATNYNGYGVSCYDETDGSIILNVSGGLSPYFFSWSNNANTQNLVNVGAGTYTVTITDQNGCIQTASATLTQPVEMVAVAYVTSDYNGYGVSCYGAANGAIDLTVTGGITPLVYIWSNGATSQDISNIAAGIYTATVTDQNGCQSIASIIITQPLALQVSAVVATNYNGYSVSCYGATNGVVDLLVDFGVTPYSFVWSNGATTQNLTAVGAGSYMVTVTDANGCAQETGVTLTQPSMITSDISLANVYNGYGVSCNGLLDGAINLVVTGGMGNYTFIWSNGATTQSLTGIGAGTYSVTITDSNGCAMFNSIDVTEPEQLVITLTPANITCYGYNNGSINTTVSGGNTPYSFVWSNTAVIQNLINLGPGTYSVTVTDANNCTITSSTLVTEPPALDVSAVITHEGCASSNTGAIDITPSGGTPPFTFLWSDGATTQDISNVAAGSYSLTITDGNNCQIIEQYTIQPGLPGPVAYFQYVISNGAVSFINFSTPTLATDSTITYFWDFGVIPSTTDTSSAFQPLYIYTTSGDYIVTLTVTNDCGTSVYVDTVPIRIIDIPEINDIVTSLNLYPNPNNGLFTLSYESSRPVEDMFIRIVDVSGQILETCKYAVNGSKFMHEYDISQYSIGIYFIEVITANGVLVRRIIMDHK
jgi:hypothetical protein